MLCALDCLHIVVVTVIATVYILLPDRWSSPTFTGQPPHAGSSCTLTPVGNNRAAMIDGFKLLGNFSDLFIAELGKNSVVSVHVVSKKKLC